MILEPRQVVYTFLSKSTYCPRARRGIRRCTAFQAREARGLVMLDSVVDQCFLGADRDT